MCRTARDGLHNAQQTMARLDLRLANRIEAKVSRPRNT